MIIWLQRYDIKVKGTYMDYRIIYRNYRIGYIKYKEEDPA